MKFSRRKGWWITVLRLSPLTCTMWILDSSISLTQQGLKLWTSKKHLQTIFSSFTHNFFQVWHVERLKRILLLSHVASAEPMRVEKCEWTPRESLQANKADCMSAHCASCRIHYFPSTFEALALRNVLAPEENNLLFCGNVKPDTVTRASKAGPPHQSQIWSPWVIDSASTLSWPDARVQKVFWHRWNWSLHASFSPWMKARPCTNKLIDYVTHMTYISCSKEKKADRAATVSGGLKLLSAFSVSSAKWNLLHSECSKPSPGHLHLAHLDTLWHLHFQVLPGWRSIALVKHGSRYEHTGLQPEKNVMAYPTLVFVLAMPEAAWHAFKHPDLSQGLRWKADWQKRLALCSLVGVLNMSSLLETRGIFQRCQPHCSSWVTSFRVIAIISSSPQGLIKAGHGTCYLSRLNPSAGVLKMLYTGIRYTSKWPLQ